VPCSRSCRSCTPTAGARSSAATWCDRALGSLYGRYLYGDNCKSDIRAVRLSQTRATGDRATGLRVPGPSSFGEDARGRVYVASLTGPVYRLTR
jgi:hypothetical protein